MDSPSGEKGREETGVQMVGIKGQLWSPRSPVLPVCFLSAVRWEQRQELAGPEAASVSVSFLWTCLCPLPCAGPGLAALFLPLG